MATTTPNYGWDVPTSTDYVAQGAVAIETLGDDIDASLFSITAGKNVGMVPLSITSFTAATSVIVSNVFTSDYENYKVIFASNQNTASGAHQMRLRASGVDNASGFYGGGVQNYANSNTLYSYRMNGAAEYTMGSNTLSVGVAAVEMTIFAPQRNVLTRVSHKGVGDDVSGTYSHGLDVWYNGSTQFDGLKILTTGGTFTGTLRIYGLRNS